MFRYVVVLVLALVVDALLQPDEWRNIIAERRKQHKPSPQQLAKTYREADAANKKAKMEHQAYLKSPEHHAEMVHAGNKIAERARHETAVPYQKHCGMTVPFSKSGYKNTDLVRSIFHLADSWHSA